MRIGIMGCGSIAGHMAATIRQTEGVVLTAAAAREEQRAKKFAQEHGAEKYYGSYADLAADTEVDAVYVATIHPAHASCIRLCLENGKAVLCEKPLAMSYEEAVSLFRLAEEKKVLLMEGIWTRYLPAWQEIRRLVKQGEIGAVRNMQADFSVNIPFDPDSRVYNLEKGAGALLDVGVYSIHALLHILGTDYADMKAMGRLSPTGSDSCASVLLRYPDGRLGEATCGCDVDGTHMAHIYGDKGRIDVQEMFAASSFTLCKTGEDPQPFVFAHEGFRHELQEFVRLADSKATMGETVPPKDTITASRIIEEAMRQLQSRK